MPLAATRRLVRHAFRTVAVSAVALTLVTCTDSPIGPGKGGIAYIRLQPVFDIFSRVAPLTLDRVRVVVVRPATDTLADVSQAFSATATSVRLDIPVRLERTTEDLEVNLELYAGSTLLFAGTDTIPVTAGSPNAAAPIPVTYKGPGQNVASLSVLPSDTTVFFGAAIDMQASAVDSQQAAVAQFYVSWTATGGTIDASGRFTAPSVRDTVFVKAVTPTGILDSTRVFITAPPATLVKVGGDAQSASIGVRLPLPLVVRVDGSDGRPVPGVLVSFAAIAGGGSVDSATYLSDPQGLASMGATLGLTVGAQTFSASAPGVAPVTFNVSATSGGLRTWTGAVSTDWNTAGNWNPAALPTAGDSVVIPTTAPNDPTLTGNATVGAVALQGSGASLQITGILTVQRGIALPDSNNTLRGIIRAASVAVAGYQALLDLSAGGSTVTGTTGLSGDQAVIDARLAGHSFGPVNIAGNQSHFYLEGNLSSPSTSGPVTVSAGDWNGWGGSGGGVGVTGAPAMTITGTGAAFVRSGVVTLNGNVIVGGTAGRLANFSIGSATTWVINGNLQTTAGGFVVQQQNFDTVRVNGNASFGGGDETGQLAGGTLFVSGNFTQSGASTSFVGTGTHTVFLNGAGAQTLNFGSPGFGTSRFQNVIIANSAGAVTATSDLYASGTAGVTPTAVRTLSGNGGTLFTTILNVSNFTFNNLLLNFAGSTVVGFDGVTFLGYSPTATPLTIAHPGAATPFQFTNVSFGVTPTSGFYLSATDTSPTDGVSLAIDMFNPSPLSPGGFVQVAGGATVTWPSGVSPGTWTGVVDTSWNTAGNWSDGNVPTTATDVTIPVGALRAPTITTLANARNLTVQAGATLNINLSGLNLSGSLDAQGTLNGISTGINLTGTGTIRGNLTGTSFTTLVNGSYSLNGRLVTPGLTINGRLDLAGFSATVGGPGSGNNFQTSNNGVLVMQSPTDSLIMVGGNSAITFGGGSTVGQLTAGVIVMNTTAFTTFTQSSTFSSSSYAPSGTHKVVLNTGATLSLSFATPGTGSHFNILDISAQAAGFSLATPIRVNGTFISMPVSTAPAINGGNRLLTAAGGTQVTGLTLTNAPMAITGSAPVVFDNVQFQSMNAAGTQLAVSGPGAAAPLVFNNLVFATPPTTGLYLSATDSDGPTPDALTVNLVNATPSTPSTFTQVNGGAVINWPAASPALSWNGSTNADWNTASNWTPAVVPDNTTDLTIIAGTPNDPVISSNAQARDVHIGSGTTLTANALLDVYGLFDGAGGAVTGSGTVRLRGTGQTVQGSIDLLEVGTNASYTAVGALGTTDLTLNGSLTVGGQVVLVQNNLSVFGSGLLAMQNPSDYVFVANQATFGGGASAGFLTEGTLEVQGKFTQSNANSASSFSASGNHTTTLPGSAFQQVVFSTPGSGTSFSHFANLDVSLHTAGLVDFVNANIMVVEGQLIALSPSGFVQLATSNGGQLSVGGVSVHDLVLNSLPLIVGGGVITQFDAVTFSFAGAADGAKTQLTVNHPGAATPFVFDALTFQDAPTTGRYLVANDIDGVTPNALSISLTSPNPSTPGGFVLAQNGAVINWPAASPVFTWTGTADQNWTNGANWSTGTVPTGTDNVNIPAGTPNEPTINSSTAVNDLTILAGATLTTVDISLTVNGNLDASGLMAGCCNDFIGLNGSTLRGNFDQAGLTVNPGAVVTLNGATTLTNSTVTIDGELIVNGQTLNVDQGLSTRSGTGLLTMTNPADQVLAPLASFSGGDETGHLTAGVLRAQQLSQGGTVPSSFFAGGNHRVILSGTGFGTLSFADPVNSHFQDLDVTAVSGALTLGSDVTVAGQLISIPIATNGPTIKTSAPGSVLTAGGADVGATAGFTALTMDGVPLVLGGQQIAAFSHVTFLNQNPLGTQLTVNDPGTAAPYVFSNLSFGVQPTTGFYMSATDVNPSDGNPLTIDVIGASPASGAPYFTTAPGAVINWPATGSIFTWDGSADQNWSNPANWDRNAVPGVIDDVILVPITNQPVMTSSTGINNLTIQAGATLDVDTTVLVVGGTLDNAGVINGVAGTGGMVLTGTGKTMQGTVGVDVFIPGSYTLNGNFSALSVAVAGASGSLDLTFNTLTTTNEFSTLNSGTLTMTDPGAQLTVGGSALFAGGDETGKLTAGKLLIGGDFAQLNSSSSSSFAPSGSHTTAFTSPSTVQNVDFTSPGAGASGSHFQVLDLSNATGGISLSLNTIADVVQSTSTSAKLIGNGASLTARQWQVQGMVVDNAPMILDEQGTAVPQLFDNVSFTGFPTTATTVSLMDMTAVGAALAPRSITFSNLTVQTSLGTGGLYAKLVSSNSLGVTLTISGSNDPTGGPSRSDPPFGTTVNGARIVWQ